MLEMFKIGERWPRVGGKLNAMVKALQALATLRGDGIVTVTQVSQTGYMFGIDLGALNDRLPKWLLKWGKATAAWTSGNEVTLDPCWADGVDSGQPNITAYVFTPTTTTPTAASVHVRIAQNDVLAYLSYGDKLGVLVNPPIEVVGNMFAVRTWSDGGAQGTAAAQATWTYTVRTVDATAIDTGGLLLGEDMTPLCRTQATNWEGVLDYPPVDGGGWVGVGYYNATGTFCLWDAGERPYTAACP